MSAKLTGPIESSCVRRAGSSASIAGRPAGIRPSTTLGTTSRCWPASPVRSGMGRRSRTLRRLLAPSPSEIGSIVS
jgi:hypothetical protein